MTKPDPYVLVETGIPEQLVRQVGEMIDSGKYVTAGGIAITVITEKDGSQRVVYAQAMVRNAAWGMGQR